jgi:hypothetical protein
VNWIWIGMSVCIVGSELCVCDRVSFCT